MLGTAFGASPLPFQTTGFMLGPIHEETGWSLSQISLGVTIYGVLAAFLAPLFGAMSDRWGVRRVALASTLAFGLVFASFSLLPPSLVWFYALWTLVGLVGIGSTPITWSRAVNLWFFRNRGLALGLTLVGTSIAAMILPTLTVTLIHSVGWRGAYAGLALLPLAIALPVAIAFFREPRPEERPSELNTVDASGKVALGGLTLRECLAGRRFWILVVSIFCIAFAYGGSLVHMPQMLKAQGFVDTQAAIVVSLFGVSIFAGRIITGLLLDRFWAPLVTLPILCLPALSCLLLASDNLSFATAVFAAFLLGFSSGAETDLIAYLAGRYFGMANYGRIYGSLYMVFGIASALSPLAYGNVRDRTGSYDLILYVAAAMFVVGALLLLTLGRYPTAADLVSRLAAGRGSAATTATNPSAS
ncbi:MAG: MFS transporter [Sinobacteraceae bacterium]|nr:MFS transporter [Nevskiaceae bacterium]MCP5338558.1 MFS transporter [Nevskiaceae bacterium]MCP5466764.1 MFS transporter [Nevskiaceae bacterium]MCP5470565.1 MFS transporter [Nevskiaceae bacterium]